MNFPQLIKQTRIKLKESQGEFGKRFGISHAAVSDYERGTSEAGYDVINFVLGQKDLKCVHEYRCIHCLKNL